MNVVESHNQDLVLFILPHFPHHVVISRITKLLSVAKGGAHNTQILIIVALTELTLNAL